MMSNDVIQKRRQPVLLNTIRDSQDEVSPVSSKNVEFKMLPPSHVLCSLFLGITYVGGMWILST